jgi:hypothetical protein
MGSVGGVEAPPTTVGGYTMTEFGADSNPLGASVGTIASPLGGSIALSDSSGGLAHEKIGDGWATWSNGYTGDVYWNQGAGNVTINMTPSVGAFDLYAEPDAFSPTETITVTGSDGSSLTLTATSVSGDGGAVEFQFYGVGTTISSITVSDPSSNDFAIGEFGISAAPTPEPASLTLLGIGAVGMIGYALRRRKNAAVAAN